MTLTSIGSYSVTRQLPGDGDTYLARSARGDRCHLWLLSAEVDESTLEETRQQMNACNQMEHSALVAASDLFTTDAHLAIAMGAADGADCAQLLMLIGRGNLTLAPEAVWYIGHQLAGALAVAHAGDDEDFLSISHGFVSPNRVRIGWDGSVRLEGFGLAPLVSSGVLQGEKGFVAPEQRGGGRVTPRGDLYALAAVLMALLTGRLPGPGATLDKRVPESLHEPLERALEESLGKRRVTAMEMEQWLAQASAQKGRSALAGAVAKLRKSSAKLGGKKPSMRPKAMSAARGSVPPKRTSRSAIPQVAKPGGLRANFGAKRKIPPLRSRQSTLMGGSANEEIPRRQSTTPFNMDWDQVTVNKGDLLDDPIGDELSWAQDDNPTTVMDRDSLLEAANAVLGKPGSLGKPGALGKPGGKSAAVLFDDDDDDDDLTLDEEDEATVMFSRNGLSNQVLNEMERRSKDLDDGEAAAEDASSKLASDKDGEALVATLDDDTKLFKPEFDLDEAKARLAKERAAQEDEADPLEKTAVMPDSGSDPFAGEPDKADAKAAPADEPAKEEPAAADDGADAEAKADAPAADAPAADAADDASADAPAADDAADSPTADAPAADADEAAAAAVDVGEEDVPVADPAPPSSQPDSGEAGDASPWASADDEPDDKPLSLASMVLIVLVSAAVVFVAGMMWVRSNAVVGPPPVPSGAGSAPTAAKSAAAKSAATAPKPKARPTAATSAKPKASAKPTATATSAAEMGPDGVSDDPEAAAVAATIGLLRVRYTGPEKDAQVFLRGTAKGPVGTKVQIPCNRFAFITVGKPGPIFLSKGTTVKVECQKLTQITIKPK